MKKLIIFIILVLTPNIIFATITKQKDPNATDDNLKGKNLICTISHILYTHKNLHKVVIQFEHNNNANVFFANNYKTQKWQNIDVKMRYKTTIDVISLFFPRLTDTARKYGLDEYANEIHINRQSLKVGLDETIFRLYFDSGECDVVDSSKAILQIDIWEKELNEQVTEEIEADKIYKQELLKNQKI